MTLRRAFHQAVQKAQYASLRPGLTGKVENGAYVVPVPGRAQYIYVRTFQDGKTAVEEVLNLRVANKENIPVWVGKAPGGETIIMDVQQEETAAWAGSGAPGLAVGPHTHELGFGLDDPVSGRRISPLLVYCTTPASLSVKINAGFYVYNGSLRYYAGGTLDLTSYLPSTAAMWAWVLVHLHPVTGVIGATKGTEYALAQPLNDNLIADITLAGTVPLAAVKLAGSQTSISSESTFADVRAWPTGIGGSATSIILHNFAATAAPTANDDSADGYSIGSWWLDTTADKAYICLDATAAAAVWKHGAQIDSAETVTGLWTFDRDPNAPFAVSASSAVVPNLDADKLDGNEASAFAAAAHNHGTNGVVTKNSTADVTNPPSDSELDTAFGTPVTVGAGFIGILDDDGAGANVYLAASDGTNWWYTALTKAT